MAETYLTTFTLKVVRGSRGLDQASVAPIAHLFTGG